MRSFALLLHLLAATIWTGGHLVLALTILPRALRERDLAFLQRFEAGYERVGIPALVTLVLTGVYLAIGYLPSWSQWFDLSQPLSRLVTIKVTLLVITVGLALDARLRIIPRLTAANLNALAWHIVPVTVVSVLFVFVGLSFRTGWLF